MQFLIIYLLVNDGLSSWNLAKNNSLTGLTKTCFLYLGTYTLLQQDMLIIFKIRFLNLLTKLRSLATYNSFSNNTRTNYPSW